MIDSRKKLPPILKCPTCKTLYGPKIVDTSEPMTTCSRCGGPLVPAPGPKRLPDVPFATRRAVETYKQDVPVARTREL